MHFSCTEYCVSGALGGNNNSVCHILRVYGSLTPCVLQHFIKRQQPLLWLHWLLGLDLLIGLFYDSHLPRSLPVYTRSSLLSNNLLLPFKTLLYLPMSKLIAGGEKGVMLFDLIRPQKKCEFYFSTLFKDSHSDPTVMGEELGELPQETGWNNYLSCNCNILWLSGMLSRMWFLLFLPENKVFRDCIRLNCILSVHRAQGNKPTTLKYTLLK